MPAVNGRALGAPWRGNSWLCWLLGLLISVALALSPERYLPASLCIGATVLPGAQFGFGESGVAGLTALKSHFIAWVMMVGAMAVVLIFPMAQYVAVRSFRERRSRSVGMLVAGYFGVWCTAFLPATGGLLVLHGLSGQTSPILAAFLFAAGWQVCPAKYWALSRCHRTFRVRVDGIRADVSCFAFGVRHGGYCALSCLPMMIACMAAEPHWLTMPVTAAIAFFERSTRKRRPHRPAVALVILGLGTAMWNGGFPVI